MKRLLYIALLFPVFLHAQSINIYTPSATVCNGTPVLFTAIESGITNPHYHWKVNGVNAGNDSLRFVSTPNNGDSIICLLTNRVGDTIFATSNSIIMTVQVMPVAVTITGYDTVCVGATTTLSDNITGGVWSAGNTCASVSGGVVTGIATYPPMDNPNGIPSVSDSIYYAVTNTCGGDTASIIITIYAIPYAFLSLSDLCVNTSEPIIDIGSDEESYPSVMYASNGCAGFGNSYIYGAYAGTDTIYGIASDVCGSDTAADVIQIISVPAQVISPIFAQSTTVCAGATIVLIDSSSGTPGWSASNGSAIVDNNGIVTGISPGLDTINLSIAYYYCGMGPNTTIIPPIVITVDPGGPIIFIGNVCVGQPVILFDSVAGGVWSDENPTVAMVKPGTIQPGTAVVTTLLPGVDTIFYTLPGGCTVNTPLIVNPSPAPISGDNVFCIGAQMNLADTGNGIWSTNNSGIVLIDPFAGTINITGTSMGVATITYTNDSGCSAIKQVRIVNCSNDVTIFPNPVINELVIQIDTTNYNAYSVINCIGQQITKGQLTQTLTEIETSSWPPGMYIIQLWGTLTYVSKLVKE